MAPEFGLAEVALFALQGRVLPASGWRQSKLVWCRVGASC